MNVDREWCPKGERNRGTRNPLSVMIRPRSAGRTAKARYLDGGNDSFLSCLDDVQVDVDVDSQVVISQHGIAELDMRCLALAVKSPTDVGVIVHGPRRPPRRLVSQFGRGVSESQGMSGVDGRIDRDRLRRNPFGGCGVNELHDVGQGVNTQAEHQPSCGCRSMLSEDELCYCLHTVFGLS